MKLLRKSYKSASNSLAGGTFTDKESGCLYNALTGPFIHTYGGRMTFALCMYAVMVALVVVGTKIQDGPKV